MMRLRKIPFVILLLPLVAAIVLYHYFCHTTPNNTLYCTATWQAQLTTVPQIRQKNIKAEAQLIWRKDSSGIIQQKEKILLYISRDSLSENLTQGDSLLFVGTIKHANRGNPYEFDYDSWLHDNGLSGVTYISSGSWVKNGNGRILTMKAVADRCRHWFISVLQDNGIKGEDMAIVSAMTVGEKSELDTSIRRKYAAAGASHVLAVSGLHTGIVYGAIMLLLTGFGFFPLLYKNKAHRTLTAIISIVLIWSYAFLTGLSPSVMRASLMITIFVIGNTTYRTSTPYNSLAAAAFINLLIEPQALFTVSFQLSYAAVSGILLFYKNIKNIVVFRTRLLKYVWNLLCLSISAQLGVLPVSLWYFQQTSNYFALTNLLVIPLATLIIYSSTLLAALSFTPFSTFVGFVVSYLAKVMNMSVGLIDSLPSATNNISLTPATLIMLILTIITLAIWLNQPNKWQSALPTIVSMFLTLTLHFYHLRHINNIEQTYIFNESYTLITNQHGRGLTIYTDDINSAILATESLRKQMMIKQTEIVDLSNKVAVSTTIDNQRILLLHAPRYKKLWLNQAIATDIVIATGKGKISYQNIVQNTSAKQLIVLSDYTERNWQLLKDEKEQTIEQIPVRYARSGAILLQ